MPESSAKDWNLIGRQIALSADVALRILTLSPEERIDAARELRPVALAARTASDLAESICQARELLRLLEEAEAIWLEILVKQTEAWHRDDAGRG